MVRDVKENQQQQHNKKTPRVRNRRSPSNPAMSELNIGFANADWLKKTVTLAIGYTGTGYYGLQ